MKVEEAILKYQEGYGSPQGADGEIFLPGEDGRIGYGSGCAHISRRSQAIMGAGSPPLSCAVDRDNPAFSSIGNDGTIVARRRLVRVVARYGTGIYLLVVLAQYIGPNRGLNQLSLRPDRNVIREF